MKKNQDLSATGAQSMTSLEIAPGDWQDA